MGPCLAPTGSIVLRLLGVTPAQDSCCRMRSGNFPVPCHLRPLKSKTFEGCQNLFSCDLEVSGGNCSGGVHLPRLCTPWASGHRLGRRGCLPAQSHSPRHFLLVVGSRGVACQAQGIERDFLSPAGAFWKHHFLQVLREGNSAGLSWGPKCKHPADWVFPQPHLLPVPLVLHCPGSTLVLPLPP